MSNADSYLWAVRPNPAPRPSGFLESWTPYLLTEAATTRDLEGVCRPHEATREFPAWMVESFKGFHVGPLERVTIEVCPDGRAFIEGSVYWGNGFDVSRIIARGIIREPGEHFRMGMRPAVKA
jgi:hypothetical protein